MLLIFINMKTIYAIQPYEVGTKYRKSLAIVIPARIVKECKFSTSTVFAIQLDKERHTILLQTVRTSFENTEQTFEASKQQTSVETQ